MLADAIGAHEVASSLNFNPPWMCQILPRLLPFHQEGQKRKFIQLINKGVGRTIESQGRELEWKIDLNKLRVLALLKKEQQPKDLKDSLKEMKEEMIKWLQYEEQRDSLWREEPEIDNLAALRKLQPFPNYLININLTCVPKGKRIRSEGTHRIDYVSAGVRENHQIMKTERIRPIYEFSVQLPALSSS
ncbi:hypothetical protein Ccrd_026358 [Cynara cardunculus var. scolymus]|uniref:Uncharacterized protein n=1 Tax=Cynara cardunculus var. scolymus TaxID=59895 RepID=A0A103XDD4_CYNCS|nr:hypothetical protein Ccrd_026358 [Cynara cardunculus var. scolymus]